MQIYDILMRHAGPKSQVEFVLKRVIADSEEAILARVDADLKHGAWSAKSTEDDEGDCDDGVKFNADGDRLHDIYDDDFNIVGSETYLQKMLRLRGEYHDDGANYDDAYYGIEHYGWSKGREISGDDAAVLQRLGLVDDWRANATEA